MKTSGKILFLSYDGMTDPLGQSQVLSYLEGLSRLGHVIHLVSYEKPEVYAKMEGSIRERLIGSNITWHPLKYTKSPPIFSTLYDLWQGWQVVKKIMLTEHLDIVHCRGYVTSLLGRKMKRKFNTKFIFDMRGWWVDEKKESGLWSAPIYVPIYTFFKSLEKSFFTEADRIVSLTYVGKEEIINKFSCVAEKIPVIPTCVNFLYFPPYSEEIKKQVRQSLGISLQSKVLVYSGSLGGNYSTDTLYQIYQCLYTADNSWQLLILSKTDSEFILSDASKFPFDTSNVFIKNVEYQDVSRHLMAGDVGLIFYNKTYSVIGRCPTKMGEYLSSGLPILSISGIGDLDFLMEKFQGSGYLLSEINPESCAIAAVSLLSYSEDKTKLRNYALEYFDLSKGIEAYNGIYTGLLN